MQVGNLRLQLESADRMLKIKNILLSDTTFILTLFSTMVCYGMFCSIPGSLIYEIKFSINEGMRIFGYLMMALKAGKIVGHLIAIKLCSMIKATRYPDFHLGSMAVQLLGVTSTPFCTSWFSLGICWSIVGVTLGTIESNVVFLNTAINREKAAKYTNIFYCCYSAGAAFTPIIVSATKQMIEEPKVVLSTVCWIVGGVNFTLNLFVCFLLCLRRSEGKFIPEMPNSVTSNKPENFRRLIFSNICFTGISFFFMCGRTSLELFLLPFTLFSKAGLDENQSYVVIQLFFVSSLAMRVIGILIGLLVSSTSKIMVGLNLMTLLGVLSMAFYQDRSYEGIIVTMILLGFVLGAYQNSILNWLTDRMNVTTRNTAPFFFGTTFGSCVAPAIVPHLIKNEDGTINVGNYETVVIVLFTVSVGFCVGLMCAEAEGWNILRWFRNDSLVKEVNIVGTPEGIGSEDEDEASVNLPNLANASRMTFMSGANRDRTNTGSCSVGGHTTPLL